MSDRAVSILGFLVTKEWLAEKLGIPDYTIVKLNFFSESDDGIKLHLIMRDKE